MHKNRRLVMNSMPEMQVVETNELLIVEGGGWVKEVGLWLLNKLTGGGGNGGGGGGGNGGGGHAVVDCRGGCNGATIIIH
jgi:hypothetical protein